MRLVHGGRGGREPAGKGGGACVLAGDAKRLSSLLFAGERGIRVAGSSGSAFRRREAKRRGQLVFGSVGVGLGFGEIGWAVAKVRWVRSCESSGGLEWQ